MRVLITIGCLLAARALAYLPLLGVHNPDEVYHFYCGNPPLGGAYSLWANSSNIAMLPALMAIFLVSLVIVIVPPLRRQAVAGKAEGWREWAVVGLSVPLGIFFGFILCGIIHKSVGTQLFPFGVWLPVLHMTIVSTGMTLLALLINRKGWGNGFVLIPATAVFLYSWVAVRTMWGMFVPKGDILAPYSFFHLIALGTLALFVVGATILFSFLWLSERAEPSHGRHAMELFLAILIARAITDCLMWIRPLASAFHDTAPYGEVAFGLACTLFVTWVLVSASPREVNAHLIPLTRSRSFWIVTLGMGVILSMSQALTNMMAIPYAVAIMMGGFGTVLLTGSVICLLFNRKTIPATPA